MCSRIPTFIVLVSMSCFGCGAEIVLEDLPLEIRVHGLDAIDSAEAPPPEADVVVVHVGEIDFCPPHVCGDRDFKGHGPCVKFTAQARVSTAANALDACVYMKAEEWQDGKPKEDYTTAEGWCRRIRVPAPEGTRIVGLAPGQEATFRHSYLDDDHECDVFGFSPHRLVRRLVYTGDTRGEDAGVVTGVTASFNAIAVLVVDE